MNLRRLRRRAFWIGVRSVFDLSGQRTVRDMRKLAREATPSPVESFTWQQRPVNIRAGSTTDHVPPITYSR